MLKDETGQVGIGRYNSQLTGPAFTSGADVVCLDCVLEANSLITCQ